MSAEVANELWTELKRYVNTVDRADAAETVVSILIDHDSTVEEIQEAFKGDKDIKAALTMYLDNDQDYNDGEDEELDEDPDYSEDDDWEN